jgi:hypothetical protein
VHGFQAATRDGAEITIAVQSRLAAIEKIQAQMNL